MKILILGGGPAGLGAAWRLMQLGHDRFSIHEALPHWGGLSASYKDTQGFVWDFGGHVLFSHYSYFDQVMNQVMDQDEWLVHDREAWIFMQDRFIPYPLQNNVHHLPKKVCWDILEKMIDIDRHPPRKLPAHFGQWIDMSYGTGLAEHFLRPYNYKVWAFEPEQMGWNWVGERVAPIDLKGVLKNLVFEQDSRAWGPNSTFRFPASGGTGTIWNRIAQKIPDKRKHLGAKAVEIDTALKTVLFENGSKESFDVLFSTMPLTRLASMTKQDRIFPNVRQLKHASTHVVGIALDGQVPDELATKCWMYFPEDNCPFYRVTVFSNYAPDNVPSPGRQWSLMCEVSESQVKKVNRETLVDDVLQGALNTGLVKDLKQVDHTWYHTREHGYPVPCVRRNDLTDPLLVHLENMDIYSRGRFGAWKYEVGNMDHSFMQGVEFADRIFSSCRELTLWYPGVVNAPHPSGHKATASNDRS